VQKGEMSAESQQLIDDVVAENDGTLLALTPENKGGFRVRVDQTLVKQVFQNPLTNVVLSRPSRNFVFEEGAWIRPTPRTVVLRDATIVFYDGGDGVPPHVDGKDGTLLLYLSSVPTNEDVGGKTVFS
jgi:hypothetical protein